MRIKISPAKLSRAQKNLISLFVKKNILEWSDKVIINKMDYSHFRDEIKEDIRLYLMLEQDFHCAYCGLRLLESTPLIEHIADKSKKAYRDEMFNPLNLVLACLRCNLDRKKTRDSVLKKNGNYKKWSFKIIHPILDNPEDHIVFDEDFILITEMKTTKGQNTVEWFDLNNPILVEARQKQYLFKKNLLDNESSSLIEATLEIPKIKKSVFDG